VTVCIDGRCISPRDHCRSLASPVLALMPGRGGSFRKVLPEGNIKRAGIARRIRAQAQPGCDLGGLFQHALVLFLCHGQRMAQTVLAVTVRGQGFAHAGVIEVVNVG